MAEDKLATLAASLRGSLITRQDEQAFEKARWRGWNRDLNHRVKPLGFAVVSGVHDIVQTVKFCTEHSIPLTVRGKGAHSPYGMAQDAIVIDLIKMVAVRVDPEKKLAYIQAGADGGDVDHETCLFGLACPVGTVSHTGFAGVALGGGVGHLARWLGVVVDNIVGYEMVTAEGKVIRVTQDSDPELFWGMRGNGYNFGIVTEFTLKLAEMPNGGIVRGAPIVWPNEKTAEVCESWLRRIAEEPRKNTEALQMACFYAPDGNPVTAIVPCIVGETPEVGQEVCDKLAEYGGGAVARLDADIPYVALNQAMDEACNYGRSWYDKGCFIDYDKSDDTAIREIAEMTAQCWDSRPEWAGKNPFFVLHLEVSGAVHEMDLESTSFSGRKGRFWCNVLASWDDEDWEMKASESRKWVKEWVGKFSKYQVVSYVNNYMAKDEEDLQNVYPTKTMERLKALKEKLDPNGMFRTSPWHYKANE